MVAEHFASRGVRTRVVGVPASIDGDLQGRGIEASIGFDTACLTYASIIANLATDAASARKYWCVGLVTPSSAPSPRQPPRRHPLLVTPSAAPSPRHPLVGTLSSPTSS